MGCLSHLPLPQSFFSKQGSSSFPSLRKGKNKCLWKCLELPGNKCDCVRMKYHIVSPWASLGGSVVKNLPASAGDTCLINGSGRSPEKGMATHSSILAWEIPWTEEPGRLKSMGSQRVRHGSD